MYRVDDVRRLYVYEYHFLDDLRFVRKPADVLAGMDPYQFDRLTAAVRDRFLSAGWEGDGELGMIWLPPFVDAGIEDTWGTYVWHVKQSYNGTSWLASMHPLDFKRLRDQNEEPPWKTHVPASVVHTECRAVKKAAEALVAAVSRRMKALESVSDPVVAEIRDELLIVTQGELVGELQEFLDGCYLQVLIHVLDHGNPGRLELGKFKANLNLSRYVPVGEEEVSLREGSDASNWLTITSLIHDVWWSYKFEPFKSKTGMLFKSCDYKIGDNLKLDLTKHVLLRNCVQHHQRTVTSDALQDAGLKEFTIIREDKSTMKLGVGKKISFSVNELESFCQCLGEFAVDFDKYMGNRVHTVVWVPADDKVTSRGDRSQNCLETWVTGTGGA